MKIAAFTIVRNEDVFLPIWYKHYLKHFDEHDIYIIDNGSDNEINYKNVERIESDYCFDHAWLRKTAYKMMERLLQNYDYVMCTDADEILIPNTKRYSNIYDYVNKNKKRILHSVGYEVISCAKDMPIDFTGGLLEQRNKWVKLKNFYKPVLSSVPIKKMYSDYNCAKNGDPDLCLIHLNRIDYKTAYSKYLTEKKYKWSQRDMNNTDGWQHRLTTDDAFDDNFIKIKKAAGKIEIMPDWIRCVI